MPTEFEKLLKKGETKPRRKRPALGMVAAIAGSGLLAASLVALVVLRVHVTPDARKVLP